MSHFILESAIFQEAEIIKQASNKARFRMTMQTVDTVNQNKRMYPRSVLDEAMTNCKESINRRSFFGELDHPCPTGDNVFNQVRQTTVMLKDVSHIVNSYQFEGNRLIGELETTNTPNGKILFGLLQDKAGIGLSMRGLAELERKDDVNIVKSPLTLIGFDAVSRPSHQEAIIDFNECRFESSMLIENEDLICLEGKCYLPDYFDKLIETKIIQFKQKWI